LVGDLFALLLFELLVLEFDAGVAGAAVGAGVAGLGVAAFALLALFEVVGPHDPLHAPNKKAEVAKTVKPMILRIRSLLVSSSQRRVPVSI
jgi:hypothetical protein